MLHKICRHKQIYTHNYKYMYSNNYITTYLHYICMYMQAPYYIYMCVQAHVEDSQKKATQKIYNTNKKRNNKKQ